MNIKHPLDPGIPYSVSVAAVNSAGIGEIDSEIGFTKEEGKLYSIYGFSQLQVVAL